MVGNGANVELSNEMAVLSVVAKVTVMASRGALDMFQAGSTGQASTDRGRRPANRFPWITLPTPNQIPTVVPTM